MRQIIDYVILNGLNPSALESEVKRKIRSGFEPFGNLTVVHKHDTGEPVYFQTVVKYENL